MCAINAAELAVGSNKLNVSFPLGPPVPAIAAFSLDVTVSG